MKQTDQASGDRGNAGRPVVHTGFVVSVNVSDGGLPKRPVERALVSADGMAGDRQRDLSHHGGAQRALCLYSAELIEALRTEGHPIEPGDTGENLTVRGVPWDAMTVGTRVGIGDLEIEITGFADPCHNLRPYFADETFTRISHKVRPGWSRVYAQVVHPGVVACGDTLSVFGA